MRFVVPRNKNRFHYQGLMFREDSTEEKKEEKSVWDQIVDLFKRFWNWLKNLFKSDEEKAAEAEEKKTTV